MSPNYNVQNVNVCCAVSTIRCTENVFFRQLFTEYLKPDQHQFRSATLLYDVLYSAWITLYIKMYTKVTKYTPNCHLALLLLVDRIATRTNETAPYSSLSTVVPSRTSHSDIVSVHNLYENHNIRVVLTGRVGRLLRQ